MRKKSFSIFFWISVVLVAVLLFVVMGRNVEGFKTCTGSGDYTSCRYEPKCSGYEKTTGYPKKQYCIKPITKPDGTPGFECGCR
jgi:hypothetical protein